jgi:hypothetical protein
MHYKVIADILLQSARRFPESRAEVLDDVSYAMADYFAADNPRFSREKFLAACTSRED